jgi:hypothetical protein
MTSRTRVAQGLLATDGAVLFCYGAVSLLFVPGAPSEGYLSWGRLLYGVLPTALGLGSVVCAVWLGFARREGSLGADSA